MEGLSEEVANPRAVDDVFIDRIQDAMGPRSDVGDDAIVYTGGFKFMIPIVTAFAMAHEVDLYYRYEKVYQIRKTHVPRNFSEGIKAAFQNVPESERAETRSSGPWARRSDLQGNASPKSDSDRV